VRGRQFELHWQPIVDLDTRAVHHFEGLTRFGAGNGPAPVIHMAEELGLIESFDLAVLEKAVARLMAPGGRTLTLAVNVSAHSLAGDAYVAALLRMTQLDPALRRRLMIEVTETAALADVEAADRRLATLRAAGVRACIDDFGAGAASFDWLRGLAVDFVKIDGAFVRRLEKDPRTSTLIAHLVALCASLKVEVIGEMIEDETTADQLRDLGVRYGQGWLFGRAEAEPILVRPTRAAARRMGVVEAWG
jgi:EAL domain-containing protein (putative c-di-GMP-specific phosphodiesterase class I)